MGRGRLGLRLGLRDALSQSLGRGNGCSLLSADYDVDLDGSAVDQQAVEGVVCLGCALRLVEGDGGASATDTLRAIGQLETLDGADRRDEVFLLTRCKVSDHTIQMYHIVAAVFRISSIDQKNHRRIAILGLLASKNIVNEHAVSVSWPSAARPEQQPIESAPMASEVETKIRIQHRSKLVPNLFDFPSKMSSSSRATALVPRPSHSGP